MDGFPSKLSTSLVMAGYYYFTENCWQRQSFPLHPPSPTIV
jgi:hypothetical protein